MRDLDLEPRQLVEQAAVDDAHGVHHQREFPTEHAAEIIGIHVPPADDPRQRMNEDVKPEIGGRLPERTQGLAIERLALQLGGDDHPRESQLDRTALELSSCFAWVERGHMREADEAAGMVALRLMHAV